MSEFEQILFLTNFALKPIQTKMDPDKNETLAKKFSNAQCTVRLKRINFEEHIPLSIIKKYIKWKKIFGTKKYTVKLNRVKLIWHIKGINFVNTSIEI